MTVSGSLERLVAENERTVLRVCRSLLRDEHLGADAAQETFVRLVRRANEGRLPERLGAWLRRVAVTTALDLSRRRSAHERAAERAPRPLESGNPLATSQQHELEERLERALALLSEGQRTVFLLRHEGGMRLAEIAETLDVSLPTVKTQFARACTKLQSSLAAWRPQHDMEDER